MIVRYIYTSQKYCAILQICIYINFVFVNSNSNSNSNSLLQVTCNKSLCIHKQEIQMNKGHKSVQESIISVIHVYYHHTI